MMATTNQDSAGSVSNVRWIGAPEEISSPYLAKTEAVRILEKTIPTRSDTKCKIGAEK